MFGKTRRIKELEKEVEKLKFWEDQGQKLARKNCELDDEIEYRDIQINKLHDTLMKVYRMPGIKKEILSEIEEVLNLNPEGE